MCALTGLAPRAAARSALHASVSQDGVTAEVNAIRFPPGDQTGPAAPPASLVSCARFAPDASAIQSCPAEMYATRLPSGDHRASEACDTSSGKARAAPVAVVMRYVVTRRAFAARSALLTA